MASRASRSAAMIEAAMTRVEANLSSFLRSCSSRAMALFIPSMPGTRSEDLHSRQLLIFSSASGPFAEFSGLLLPPNASTFTPSRPSADPNMSSGTLAASGYLQPPPRRLRRSCCGIPNAIEYPYSQPGSPRPRLTTCGFLLTSNRKRLQHSAQRSHFCARRFRCRLAIIRQQRGF